MTSMWRFWRPNTGADVWVTAMAPPTVQFGSISRSVTAGGGSACVPEGDFWSRLPAMEAVSLSCSDADYRLAVWGVSYVFYDHHWHLTPLTDGDMVLSSLRTLQQAATSCLLASKPLVRQCWLMSCSNHRGFWKWVTTRPAAVVQVHAG